MEVKLKKFINHNRDSLQVSNYAILMTNYVKNIITVICWLELLAKNLLNISETM